MPHSLTALRIGDFVSLRFRHWLVEGADQPRSAGDATRLRLRCIDDDAPGQELEVLWERELDAKVIDSGDFAHLGERGFDPANGFAAHMRAVWWNAVSASNKRLLQAPFHAGNLAGRKIVRKRHLCTKETINLVAFQ
jgi:hypothetical protein